MLGRVHSLAQRLPLRTAALQRCALQKARLTSTRAARYSLRSKLLAGAVLSSSAATVALLTADKWESQLPEDARAFVRIMNLNLTVTTIVLDYAYALATRSRNTEYDAQLAELQQAQTDLEEVFSKAPTSKSDAEKKEWEARVQLARQRVDTASATIANMEAENQGGWLHDVHQRSAVRLRDMCAKNRGVYIKVGQHLAQMDYMIPVEYCEELRSLLDSTPVSSFESVRRTIQEDFGAPLEELFSQFDEVPIASASLAQVHVAYDKQGRKCAVKVQHEGLLEGSKADRNAITIIVERVEKLFSQFQYSWLTQQMNETLPLEMDFLNEARNVARIAEILKRYCGDDVIAPDVYRASPRVLVMSWEDGVYARNVEQIKESHIATAEVSRLINKAFCDQIFREGFVHCDPHEANLLVREHPRKGKGHPQIVLLDHGLYRELDDEFRTDYCRLWQSILLSDEAKIEYYCRKMGVDEMYHLLAAMLTMRPWDDIASNDFEKLQARGTSSDNAMIRAYAFKYFKHIADVLTMVRPELLLLFKTNDCLRHIDRSLGTPFNSSILIAKTCNDVLLTEDLKKASSWGDIWGAYYSYYSVFTRINMFGLMAWIQQWWK